MEKQFIISCGTIKENLLSKEEEENKRWKMRK